MNVYAWTAEDCQRAATVLRRFERGHLEDALPDVERAVRKPSSARVLRSAFERHGMGPPSSYLRAPNADAFEPADPIRRPERVAVDDTDRPPPPAKNGAAMDAVANGRRRPELDALFAAIKHGKPVSLEDLCDKLVLPPSHVRRLVEEARSGGMQIQIEHDHIGFRQPAPSDRVVDLAVPPVVGKRARVAVISDTHFGSKYCLRAQIRDFIQHAYDTGVREVLHPGDWIDGCYKHGLWELTHHGLDEQVQDVFESLPRLPGLTYHGITGNHCGTFMDAIGVDVGDYMMSAFARQGRHDVKMYGNRGAMLKLHGAVIHLWHPRQGTSYARSYQLQKLIEKYSSAEKPSVVLAGHWHVFCHVYERGVHGVACPTFQGGGSAFGKSLGGAPAIGGLILEWEMTAGETMRGFSLEHRAYFERERIHPVAEAVT